MRRLIVPITSIQKFASALQEAIGLARQFKAHVEVIQLVEPMPYSLDLIMLDADPVRISTIINRAEVLTERNSLLQRDAFKDFFPTCPMDVKEEVPNPNQATISYKEIPWSLMESRRALEFDSAVIK